MTRPDELTDDQWTIIAAHLPPEKPPIGKPNLPHRQVVGGMLWRARTGSPWRDLPERFGTWQTVYSRFRRWQVAGIWDRVLTELHTDADSRGDLDWSLHFLDGTVIRAHPHAVGAKKGAVIRPSVEAKAAFPPRSTSGAIGTANRSPSC